MSIWPTFYGTRLAVLFSCLETHRRRVGTSVKIFWSRDGSQRCIFLARIFSALRLGEKFSMLEMRVDAPKLACRRRGPARQFHI
jgi:hypothetical protein